nr:MAG TPA: hypothetical protein [Caudoviricetes sp.]
MRLEPLKNQYFLPSARPSERAFFRLIKALLQTIRHLRAAL